MDRQKIQYLLTSLETNRKHLNPLQLEFLISLKKNYIATGVITKRQVESLYDIEEYILSASPEKDSNPEFYQAQYSSIDHMTTFNI